jgi:hypothetical protein
MQKLRLEMKQVLKIVFVFLVFIHCEIHLEAQTPQINLQRVDQMPNLPGPLEIIDYRKLAVRFDSTLYDFNATGKFWPLIWIDSSMKNYPQPVIGLYTAVGDLRQGPEHNKGMFHEALTTMGAVLSASLVGIDKSNQQGMDFVGMLKNYFNKETGWDIMMNNTCPEVALLGGGYARDWWYDVFPNLLFYGIYDRYPNEPGYTQIAKSIADRFYKADSILNGNYTWSFFDYGQMKPMKNQQCPQQDAAAGHAWVLYAAYKKFGDPRYLNGALSALSTLQAESKNTFYEVLMPFGAYLAARINAEQGKEYDVSKMLAWTFDGNPFCRKGWGVMVGKWNGIDISGIVGSSTDFGGYGYLMNTYDAAWPLVPLVRYDQSYAASIGKWMLNAANATRFFYPQYMPADHQTIPQLAAVTKGVIAYEGIIRKSGYPQYENLRAPVAQGDGLTWADGKNPPESQFSIYGSAHVGIFGSIIRSTNVAGILQLNLLATDFFHEQAFPSYLYYNPYSTGKTVLIKTVKGERVDLYNTVSGKFVVRNITSSAQLFIPSQEAAVIVCVPSGGKITYEANKMLINGIVVDYKCQKKDK